ncbi:Conserved_hypothetical protein [Hexamita inflata]|uniref:Uncharacterized protein n=1 Tax=Hexamita inflata TaxID=28002 RepID=A0AA86NJN1_9EUKA|nr:Conserved hypothetical protein [Hexamita inflata]
MPSIEQTFEWLLRATPKSRIIMIRQGNYMFARSFKCGQYYPVKLQNPPPCADINRVEEYFLTHSITLDDQELFYFMTKKNIVILHNPKNRYCNRAIVTYVKQHNMQVILAFEPTVAQFDEYQAMEALLGLMYMHNVFSFQLQPIIEIPPEPVLQYNFQLENGIILDKKFYPFVCTNLKHLDQPLKYKIALVIHVQKDNPGYEYYKHFAIEAQRQLSDCLVFFGISQAIEIEQAEMNIFETDQPTICKIYSLQHLKLNQLRDARYFTMRARELQSYDTYQPMQIAEGTIQSVIQSISEVYLDFKLIYMSMHDNMIRLINIEQKLLKQTRFITALHTVIIFVQKTELNESFFEELKKVQANIFICIQGVFVANINLMIQDHKELKNYNIISDNMNLFRILQEIQGKHTKYVYILNHDLVCYSKHVQITEINAQIELNSKDGLLQAVADVEDDLSDF